jgi:hypothetical protein
VPWERMREEAARRGLVARRKQVIKRVFHSSDRAGNDDAAS